MSDACGSAFLNFKSKQWSLSLIYSKAITEFYIKSKKLDSFASKLSKQIKSGVPPSFRSVPKRYSLPITENPWEHFERDLEGRPSGSEAFQKWWISQNVHRNFPLKFVMKLIEVRRTQYLNFTKIDYCFFEKIELKIDDFKSENNENILNATPGPFFWIRSVPKMINFSKLTA